MNAITEISPIEVEIASVLSSWGWNDAPDEVVDVARQCVEARPYQTGELVTVWKLIDEDTCKRYLQEKPEKTRTLSFIGEKEPVRVLPYVEKLLAVKFGYPYYESLDLLDYHEAIENAAVFQKCEQLNAVLLRIESAKPVLVFHEYDALVKYTTIGKSQRAQDPILQANQGQMPLLAVGSRDDISAILVHAKRVSGNSDDDEGGAGNIWNAKADTNAEPHVRELARYIDHAIEIGASDLALIPQENGALEVYVRRYGILLPALAKTSDPAPVKKSADIDGDFKLGETGNTRKLSDSSSAKLTVMSPGIASKALNFLQTQSGANPSAGWLREPGDGNLRYKSANADAYMRISIIPLNHHNNHKNLRSVSIRLFPRGDDANSLAMSLESLKVPEHIQEHLKDSISVSQGIIIFSGPVNHGKSSTIAGLIGEHVKKWGIWKKRISLEEPIERKLPGVAQYQPPGWVKDVAKRFNIMLRAFKRHDFNLIFVGEIRDSEGAEFGVRFGSSGHLFLTTLHASDSLMALEILKEQVRPELRYQLIEAMSMSASQRLIGRVCPHCSDENAIPTAEEERLFRKNCEMVGEEFEMPKRFRRSNPAGCSKCVHGSIGYLPLIELLPFTRKVKDAAHGLRRGEEALNRKVMAEARYTTLLGEGLKYVESGQADLRSILFL